jgi:hypothetical protein
MNSLDEKGQTSDEDKATLSDIHPDEEAQKDVGSPNHESHLALTPVVGLERQFKRLFTSRGANSTPEESQIVVSTSKPIQ